MILQSKYEIGQRVFAARVSYTSTLVPCPDCLGSKEWTVTTPSGESWKHPCNTCNVAWYSRGTVEQYADRPVIEEMTVGSVQIDTASDKPTRYMCLETGIGSGALYEEDRLHSTLEEAQIWCSEELKRVAGLREAEMARIRERKKKGTIYRKGKGV